MNAGRNSSSCYEFHIFAGMLWHDVPFLIEFFLSLVKLCGSTFWRTNWKNVIINLAILLYVFMKEKIFSQIYYFLNYNENITFYFNRK